MENKTLCRICFDVGHFHLSGYEVNIQGKNISIDEMIKRFSDIEFTDEKTPELICENCTHDLVQSYLFTEKILEADAKILSLTQLKEQEIYEQELQLENDDEEEVVSQSIDDNNIEVISQIEEDHSIDGNSVEGHNIENHNIEGHNMEGYNIEGKNIEGQCIEGLSEGEQAFIEEEQGDLIEESAESNMVDEMYINSETSADEHEEITSHDDQEIVSSLQIDSPANLLNTPSNYDILEAEEEQSNEPRRKYQRRNKTDNEIDKNGSFIITQFACSTTAPGMHRNINAEDTDEVTLSDVRIMNYETVEVKAGNIDVLNQTAQSELPIDDSRIYLCQYCPRAFSSSAFLVAHVRKTHGCKFCASLFEKAKDLYTHIREAHSKFECVVCGKEFASNSNMRNHLKIVHKVKVPANVSLISYKKQSDMEEEI